MNRILLYYILGWFGLVFIAILNGALRVKGFLPYMSELSAHQLSTLIGISLFAVYIWFLTQIWPIRSSRQAVIIGIIWLPMTIAFEFGFGHHVMGHAWGRLFADYNVFQGRLWVFVLIWTTIAPFLFYKIHSRN